MARRKKNSVMAEKLYEMLRDEAGAREFAQVVCETLGTDGCEWLERKVLTSGSKLSKKEKEQAERFGAVVLNDPERRALELANLMRYYEQRAQLLRDSISASEAAKLLSVSRETVHERVRSSKMIGILENGVLRIPLCQFDASGPNGVLDGVPRILAELKVPDLEKLGWLSYPNQYLEGRTPIQALKDGDIDVVIMQGRAVGVT